jgi:hypothetical protein
VSALLASALLWGALSGAPPVTVAARTDAGNLTLQVPAAGTTDGAFMGKLKDGLTHRVRYTLTLRAADTGTVLLTEILTTEVVFDLWDENFVITHAEGGTLRRVRVKTSDRVRAILDAPRFRTAFPASLLPPNQRCALDVRVDVNPISEEVLDRTRELLAPPPRADEGGAARSLLGNVARVFVNEATAGTQSRSFTVTAVPFVVPPATAPAPQPASPGGGGGPP